MDLKEKLSFCKRCTERKFESSQGIVCGISGRKPEFDNSCANFILDEKMDAKMKDNYEVAKEKSGGMSAWSIIVIILVVARILFRILRD